MQRKLELIDMRDEGGSLWIIGGKELSSILNDLKQKEIRFLYTNKGSTFTNYRPAWYTS